MELIGEGNLLKMDNNKMKITVTDSNAVETPLNNKPFETTEMKSEIKPEEENCCSEKIKGGGLLGLLQSIVPMLFELKNNIPSPEAENPFEVLEDDDFDSNDEVVKEFKDKMGGVKGVVKIVALKTPEAVDHFAEVFANMHAIRTAAKIKTLRETYANIHSAKQGKATARSQVQAVDRLNKLASDASSQEECRTLLAAKNAVLKGSEELFDAAAYRVKEVFSSYVPTANIRLAYYNSEDKQEEEPCIMCPKARYQLGSARPMEISKCRNNCIDSRTTSDGKIACAYNEWLKVADSQGAVNERLEVHRNPENENNLLTLASNEKSKPAKDEDKTWEERLEAEKKRTEPNDDSIETQLDKVSEAELGRHGENKESTQEYLEKNSAKEIEAAMNKIFDKYGVLTASAVLAEYVTDYDAEVAWLKKQAKKEPKIDADNGETMTEQIESVHEDNEYDDETIEEMLNDERYNIPDEDLDKMIEELLASERDYD